MKKPARLPRISISLLFLVIVPWTIVLVATLRVLLTSIPKFETKDAQEILALARALDAYAEEFGEYPPDFTSGNPRQEIDEHLQKIFPNRDQQNDVPAGIGDLGPDNALAFWLQGFHGNNAGYPLTGKIHLGRNRVTGEQIWVEMAEEDFLAEVYDDNGVSIVTSKRTIPVSSFEDIRAQVQLWSSQQERRPLHSFNLQRLSKRDAYRPRCCDAPFVYFRAQGYSTAKFDDRPMWGVAQPYHATSMDGKTSFVESQRFQLICAGRDSFFGMGSVTVDDAAYHQGHADNFTSFAIDPLGTQRMMAWREESVLARNLSPFVAAICMLAYPVFIAFRRKEDGLVELSRIVKKQMSSMECSDTWRRKLNMQKRRRRDQALGRMRTSETENNDSTQASSPDFSQVVGGKKQTDHLRELPSPVHGQ